MQWTYELFWSWNSSQGKIHIKLVNDSHNVRSLSAMHGAIPFACSPQSDQALNKVRSLSAMCGAIPFVCSPQNDQALNRWVILDQARHGSFMISCVVCDVWYFSSFNLPLCWEIIVLKITLTGWDLRPILGYKQTHSKSPMHSQAVGMNVFSMRGYLLVGNMNPSLQIFMNETHFTPDHRCCHLYQIPNHTRWRLLLGLGVVGTLTLTKDMTSKDQVVWMASWAIGWTRFVST